MKNPHLVYEIKKNSILMNLYEKFLYKGKTKLLSFYYKIRYNLLIIFLETKLIIILLIKNLFKVFLFLLKLFIIIKKIYLKILKFRLKYFHLYARVYTVLIRLDNKLEKLIFSIPDKLKPDINELYYIFVDSLLIYIFLKIEYIFIQIKTKYYKSKLQKKIFKFCNLIPWNKKVLILQLIILILQISFIFYISHIFDFLAKVIPEPQPDLVIGIPRDEPLPEQPWYDTNKYILFYNIYIFCIYVPFYQWIWEEYLGFFYPLLGFEPMFSIIPSLAIHFYFETDSYVLVFREAYHLPKWIWSSEIPFFTDNVEEFKIWYKMWWWKFWMGFYPWRFFSF